MYYITSILNACDEFAPIGKIANTFETDRVVSPHLHVELVLGAVSGSQVLEAIVGSDAIAMIDFVFGKLSMNEEPS